MDPDKPKRESRHRTPEALAELYDQIQFQYWRNGKSISWMKKNLRTGQTTIDKALSLPSQWRKPLT
jgi:hypothetical protein